MRVLLFREKFHIHWSWGQDHGLCILNAWGGIPVPPYSSVTSNRFPTSLCLSCPAIKRANQEYKLSEYVQGEVLLPVLGKLMVLATWRGGLWLPPHASLVLRKEEAPGREPQVRGRQTSRLPLCGTHHAVTERLWA